MKLADFKPADFKRAARSLEPHMTLGDIIMSGMYLEHKDEDEISDTISKMAPETLPEDLGPGNKRSFLKLACMNAF